MSVVLESRFLPETNRDKITHNLDTLNIIILETLFQYLEYHFSPNNCRSNPPEVFFGKGVLKLCSKFTGQHQYQSVISIKLI